MRLLSRNAEALFWLARYLERGASLARVVEMQSSFGGVDQGDSWSWLLALFNDQERFKERFDVSTANIIEFYLTDIANGGSIRSSIHSARENARALRPFIPLEMWVQLNAFHTNIEAIGADEIRPTELPRTCALIRSGCLAQIGIAEGTLFRDEGYQFFRLGLLIERADQTSRLLDVKFAQGTAPRTTDRSSDFVFWSTILRTAAAYQVFHRLEHGSADPQRVARFLILNPGHPRSISFCVREIDSALHLLRAVFHLSKTNAALEACERLTAELQMLPGDAELLGRLHKFNDWVQRSLIDLTEDISAAFFRPTIAAASKPAPSKKRKKPAGQTQNQEQS